MVVQTCVFPGGGITIVRYRNEVLQPIVRPYAGAIGDTIVLMQDNARAPTARVSMTFLDDEGITVMNLPARSPHLNPIAHVRDMLLKIVKKRNLKLFGQVVTRLRAKETSYCRVHFSRKSKRKLGL